MNLKKILAIALILVALCTTLTAISASNVQTIDIGEITKSTVGITHASGASDETYKFDIEVDISDLSIFDKKALEDAINDNDTSLEINSTSELGKVTFTDYKDIDDLHIHGNTLYIKNSQTFPYAGDADYTYRITSISLESSDGVTFTAE